MTEVATARIYLGSSFASKAHKDRAAKAQEYLEQNPTVEHIHFPFDFPVVDPIESDDVKPGDLRSLCGRRKPTKMILMVWFMQQVVSFCMIWMN